LKADKGWQRRFDEPIPLPRGRQLVTLEDAGNYITKLPKAEHEAPEWQTAMEALILVVTLGVDDVRADWRDAGPQPSRRARGRCGHFNRPDIETVRNDDAEFSAPVKEIPRKINGSGDASAEFSAPSEIAS